MPVEPYAQNSVVVANQVNPTILTPQWLMQQHIIAADKIHIGSIISPHLVQIQTDAYELMVLPDRLQITPRCPIAEQATVVVGVLGGIVASLPHTPYTAIGMNFYYRATFPSVEFGAHTRDMLIKENPISRQFNADTVRCGAYYSGDFLGFRLKLTIMPVPTKTAPILGDALNLQFNFHAPVDDSDNKADIIKDRLAKWDQARHLAQDLAKSIEG